MHGSLSETLYHPSEQQDLMVGASFVQDCFAVANTDVGGDRTSNLPARMRRPGMMTHDDSESASKNSCILPSAKHSSLIPYKCLDASIGVYPEASSQLHSIVVPSVCMHLSAGLSAGDQSLRL